MVFDTESDERILQKFKWSEQLYRCEGKPSLATSKPNPARIGGGYVVSKKFEDFLEDPELPLTQNSVGALKLPDIFIYPTLKQVSSGDIEVSIDGATLLARCETEKQWLILGAEKSCKTALAKTLFADFFRKGYVPIFLDARFDPYNEADVRGLVEKAFKRQYANPDLDSFLQLHRSKRVLLIDDATKASWYTKRRDRIVDALSVFADHVILFGSDTALALEDVIEEEATTDRNKVYSKYLISPFGYALRSKLVQKWCRLSARTVDAEEFLKRTHDIERELSQLMENNFLPAYPVNILPVLQADEAETPLDLTSGAQGHIYELLVKISLGKNTDKSHYDTLLGYLTHIGHEMYCRDERSLGMDVFTHIHDDYCQKYLRRLNCSECLNELIERQVLEVKEEEVRFKFSYLYFFFAARYLSESISSEEIQSEVRELSRKLHIEDAANLLLFLAHQSSHPVIVDAMLSRSAELLVDQPEIELDGDIEFIKADLTKALVFTPSDPQMARSTLYEQMDKNRVAVAVGTSASGQLVQSFNDLNTALKTLQIVGQLLKSFPGTLDGKTKIRITDACNRLGLRALGLVFSLLRSSQSKILDRLKAKFSNDLLRLRAITGDLQDTVFSFALALSFGMISKISDAVGSMDISQVYKELMEDEHTLATKLINASIHVDHETKFPRRLIEELNDELAAQVFSQRLLHLIVLSHFHLFRPDYRLQQGVCEKLGINYKSTRRADPKLKLSAPNS